MYYSGHDHTHNVTSGVVGGLRGTEETDRRGHRENNWAVLEPTVFDGVFRAMRWHGLRAKHEVHVESSFSSSPCQKLPEVGTVKKGRLDVVKPGGAR